MTTYALIPTRSEKYSDTLSNLISYLSSIGVVCKILINRNSIFQAFEEEINALKLDDEDAVILCHDDIEILMDPDTFLKELFIGLNKPNAGFVGVAGTQYLNESGVWWNERARLKGFIFHGPDRARMLPSFFGQLEAPVVVLDGVFLAAKGKTLKSLNLKKPKAFKGEWDFYDIEYTTLAFEKGLTNYVMPILLRHESPGEIAGRDSWIHNRRVFCNLHLLPMQIKG